MATIVIIAKILIETADVIWKTCAVVATLTFLDLAGLNIGILP